MGRKLRESVNTKLNETTKMLCKSATSAGWLLPRLNEIGDIISRMDQSPTKRTRFSLSYLSQTLLGDKLLRHSDIDVKVAVAYLITEIARITAPNYPFDDGKMKDVFRLVVSAFYSLNDDSSRLYRRRVVILETVARVRFSVLMLKFEGDDLITEMLQIFFRTIRDYHPDTIFTAMETIMTQILEKRDSVSKELITTLLSSMEKDNEHVSPIARRLAEKIFQNCSARLKDSVKKAIKSLNISLDNYSEVITSVYEGNIEQHSDTVSTENLVSEDEEDSNDSASSKDLQLSESVTNSIDPIRKKRKIFPQGDETDSSSSADSLIISRRSALHFDSIWKEPPSFTWRDLDAHAEDSSSVSSVRKGEFVRESPTPMHVSTKLSCLSNLSASLQNQNSKINTERVEVTIERMQSFSQARFHRSLSTTNPEDISNSPSVLMLAKAIWKDFMSYPLKVFGNKDEEMTTLEAVSVLIENLSLFGDEEAKLLVELQDILSLIVKERGNKTRLQKSRRQQQLELEECGNVVNKLRDSVGTSKMEYDDLEKQDQELEMQERELERRMQEIRAKRKSIGAKGKIAGEKMEKESLEAEGIMSSVEEKEARNRSTIEKEANTDSEIDNLISRFFALRSQYHRTTFH